MSQLLKMNVFNQENTTYYYESYRLMTREKQYWKTKFTVHYCVYEAKLILKQHNRSLWWLKWVCHYIKVNSHIFSSTAYFSTVFCLLSPGQNRRILSPGCIVKGMFLLLSPERCILWMSLLGLVIFDPMFDCGLVPFHLQWTVSVNVWKGTDSSGFPGFWLLWQLSLEQSVFWKQTGLFWHYSQLGGCHCDEGDCVPVCPFSKRNCTTMDLQDFYFYHRYKYTVYVCWLFEIVD